MPAHVRFWSKSGHRRVRSAGVEKETALTHYSRRFAFRNAELPHGRRFEVLLLEAGQQRRRPDPETHQ